MSKGFTAEGLAGRIITPSPKPPTDRPRYMAAESKTEPGLMNCKINSMSPERWKALELLLKQHGFHPY
ncbi:hypothetical protein [Hymenobacter metallicola]|uniref:Uncharacterized protein n=1 Tax=Hymenobacter metallicola TaxID=2563114 RepID=A0A4Z0Q1Y6_9BACT|nr:hypothetical protein [Hymenobacter metallicola]TGE23509.1 hypothetical protein E5K02_20190 [Hymenobacter metallicola]